MRLKVDYCWGDFLENSWCPVSHLGFPGGSDGKESACNTGDPGSVPGSGRSPGEGSGSPLQYSCLENPMEWGAQRSIVHGVAKSRTQLSASTFIHFHTLHGFRRPLGGLQISSVDKEEPLYYDGDPYFYRWKKNLQESCPRWQSKWLSDAEPRSPGYKAHLLQQNAI